MEDWNNLVDEASFGNLILFGGVHDLQEPPSVTRGDPVL
jgi:hypothetical protein